MFRTRTGGNQTVEEEYGSDHASSNQGTSCPSNKDCDLHSGSDCYEKNSNGECYWGGVGGMKKRNVTKGVGNAGSEGTVYYGECPEVTSGSKQVERVYYNKSTGDITYIEQH